MGTLFSDNPSKHSCRIMNLQVLGAVQSHYMEVSWNGGTPKSSIFNGIFHYKPSIWGYPHSRKPPYKCVCLRIGSIFPRSRGLSAHSPLKMVFCGYSISFRKHPGVSNGWCQKNQTISHLPTISIGFFAHDGPITFLWYVHCMWWELYRSFGTAEEPPFEHF